MICRKFDLESDYDEVVGWWQAHNWPVVDKRLLSKDGLIVEDGGQKIIAIWVYRLQDSPFCIMEWMIGNPDTEWQVRDKALALLVDEACNLAKKNGADFMLSIGNHNRVNSKLEANGFQKTDENMTQLMRSL